jgi:hypothetical protein
VKYTKPLRLHGYFQSHRYFVDKYAEICNMIQLREQQTWIKQLYGNESWSNEYIGNPNKRRILVSAHFRIGDYVQNPHIHPLMTVDYYYRAISHMISASASASASSDAYTFLIFYESRDKDIGAQLM